MKVVLAPYTHNGGTRENRKERLNHEGHEEHEGNKTQENITMLSYCDLRPQYLFKL